MRLKDMQNPCQAIVRGFLLFKNFSTVLNSFADSFANSPDESIFANNPDVKQFGKLIPT